MAISGGDGSIILTTKVDESGITKSTTSIKAQFAKVGSYLKTIGTSIQTTFSKVGAGIKNTFSKIGNWLKNFATSIAAQFATIFGLYALINFSKQSAEFATQTEASVQRLVDIYGEAAQSVGDFIDANARAIGMSRSAGASIASTYGNLLSVWADQATNAELTNSLLNQTAVVASKTGRTTTDVAERIRSGLLGNTEAIEDLGINVNIKTIEITNAFKKIADGRSWEQLNAYEQAQVRTLAILEQSTNKYGTTVAETSATVRNQYQAAYEDFQNTWGQVVNTVLIPVLKVLTQVFTIATKGLQVMARLSGKTVENSGQTSSNIKQQTKEQEKLNKAVKKGLASFDEINTLTEQSAENTAGAGTGTQISGIGDLGGNYDNSFVDKVSGDMAAIMGIIGGALVAVGLLLIFFGHIGWGIGFIIAGASVFAVSMATVSSSDQVTPISEKLMAIMAIAGITLTAIGLILLFNGSWKWGIGFIIAGASALAVSIVAVESGNATEQAEQMLLDIMVIAGSAMLALGVILMCFGVISPLSIGLVVAGAGSLAGAIAINPQAVGETIKNFFQENAGLIVGVSIALIVLGIILLFTGVGIPLAIGLIVAGGGALAATVALNWNFIVDKVKEVWQKVKNFWNSYIAPIFTAKWWADLGKKAINGLLGVIESGLNWIISKINDFIGGLSKIVGAVGDVIGVDWNIPKIPKVSIPRLAQGAVIPPNREFLAVLGDQKHGTNIEAPLDTIKQAVAEVLAQVNVGSSGYNGRIEVPVIIDGREIARAVREAEGNMGTQTVFGGFANVY